MLTVLIRLFSGPVFYSILLNQQPDVLSFSSIRQIRVSQAGVSAIGPGRLLASPAATANASTDFRLSCRWQGWHHHQDENTRANRTGICREIVVFPSRNHSQAPVQRIKSFPSETNPFAKRFHRHHRWQCSPWDLRRPWRLRLRGKQPEAVCGHPNG